MDTDVRLTAIPQCNQTRTDQAETLGRVKAPTFRVQTGVRAGGFYDKWFSATEDFNQADRTAGHV